MKNNGGTIGRGWMTVAATAVSLVLAGCSSHSAGTATIAATAATSSATGAIPTIKGLLGIVPNDPNTTKNLVTVNLYQQAAKATGVAMPPPGATAKTVVEFYAALELKHGLAGSELTTQLDQYAPDPTMQLGLDASEVHADVSAGHPPDATIGAFGTFDTAAVTAEANKTSTGLTTPSYHGTNIYRWGEDYLVDMNTVNSGLFTQVGGSRRLAFPTSSTMLFATADATIHTQLDAATDPAKSLASNADFAAAAAELDKQHVFSAILTAAPPTIGDVGAAAVTGSPSAAGGAQATLKAEALAPYRLAGIGLTVTGGTSTVVIVLVNSDAATAATNATKLSAIVTKGISIHDDAPWSKLFTVKDIHAAGSLTVGTLSTTIPSAWYNMMHAPDTLLMHS